MTTDAQLEAFDDSGNFMSALERKAYDAIKLVGLVGATADEAYLRAYPLARFKHGAVDSFRVAIRMLREKGFVRDSGRKRRSPDTGRNQAVWIVGDDRDVVAEHRRAKLRKFPSDHLIDELRIRGEWPG